jgi:hypothetical protein
MAQRNGTGMFAREVMNRFPLLPLEEAGWLNDMPLRENSIERIGVYPACTLPQAQVSLTKDLLSLDGDVGEEDWQSFEDCHLDLAQIEQHIILGQGG